MEAVPWETIMHRFETLITKLKIIAIENKRSTNKEMEYALEKYVNEYEKAHGEVPV